MRWAMMTVFLVVAGCDVAGVQTSALPVTRDHALQNFELAVARVLPVAQDRCQESALPRSCHFQIVVDDRPGRSPNAFQSVDESGHPVLTFTSALIADARNPDEIALIVAHEAAHHIDGHLTQLNQQVAFVLEQESAATLALSSDQDADPKANLWSEIYARVRAFELDADARAAHIVTAAGFDAVKGAQIFYRLPAPHAHAEGSHPANRERVAAVRRAKNMSF